MKCPICENTDLLMTDRQGIEIDYCPSCRGIWLDRGELDKIIEKAGADVNTGQRSEQQANYSDHDKHDDHHKEDYSNGDRKKKKGGFLGDLMDF